MPITKHIVFTFFHITFSYSGKTGLLNTFSNHKARSIQNLGILNTVFIRKRGNKTNTLRFFICADVNFGCHKM